MKAKYFLGANSPEGFKSLYNELIDPETERLFIIKSGPGSGKSTFMRIFAQRAEALGYDTERIICSGDPDSLDGVYIPSLGIAVTDGTAPHVQEPVYAGSGGIYIDLSRFYDYEGIRGAHGEIMRLTKEYKAHYARAYDLISAAEKARKALAPELPAEAIENAIKRVSGAVVREIPPSGREKGKTRRRFLSAVSCKGVMTAFETLNECERVYSLDNEAGLAIYAIEYAAEAAEKAGWDTVRYLSPMDGRTEQLVLPELSLAFASSTPRLPYPYEPWRHLRLDAALPAEYLKTLRRSMKLPEALLSEAVNALKEAKSLHDELERVYNPYVDFKAVKDEAARFAEMILKNPAP